MSPDHSARAVMVAITRGLDQFGTIGTVSQNALSLAKDLPGPAARLLDEIISTLEGSEEACQEWRGREPGAPSGARSPIAV